MNMIPFKQGRFEDLPDLPTRPHTFFQTDESSVVLHSKPLGEMKVSLRTLGSGPPLLLLHGLMTSGYSWRYALPGLAKHYTCYVPDLPGAGRSDGPLHPAYSPQNLGTWTTELMRALDIYGCRVVANSMGGYLAMQLALRSPDSMSRLVNVHSPGVPEFKLKGLRGVLKVPGARKLLTRLVHRDPLRWAHKNVHYYDESLKSLEEAREYAAPLRTEAGVHVLYKYLAETMDVVEMQRFQDELDERHTSQAEFPIPLLLL